MRLLQPWMKADNISVIDLKMLRSNNVDTLLLDMDNTVVPWHTFDVDETTGRWLDEAKRMGFKICVISNNKKWRIVKLTSVLGVHGVWGACKPLLGGYFKALRALGSHRRTSVFVGDQLFTDIFGANIIGIRTILVNPLSQKEFRWTRIMRRLEALLGRTFDRKAGEHGD